MIDGSLSRRYAKALFGLALEQRNEEAVGEEIERFLTASMTSPLMSVLGNPAFEARKRKNILVQVTESLRLSPLVTHFLLLLLERDRLGFLPSMVSRYRRFLDEAKGRLEAKVKAARPLQERMLEKLGAALGRISGKAVILKEEVDPALIGGLQIEMEGKIYDGSVRTQLEKMTERIERGY